MEIVSCGKLISTKHHSYLAPRGHHSLSTIRHLDYYLKIVLFFLSRGTGCPRKHFVFNLNLNSLHVSKGNAKAVQSSILSMKRYLGLGPIVNVMDYQIRKLRLIESDACIKIYLSAKNIE